MYMYIPFQKGQSIALTGDGTDIWYISIEMKSFILTLWKAHDSKKDLSLIGQ